MSKEAMKLALEALSPWAGEDANHTEQYAAYQALQEALAEQPAQQEQESWEDLHNALQRIDTAAVGLPTFEVRHEGGLDAVTQNIVDAITALHVQPAQQEPVAWMELLREARDNCKASIVEEGISAIRKEYRIDLEARLTAALNTSPPARRKPLTDGEIDLMTSHIYHRGRPVDRDYRICLFREAEAAHGITGEQK